MIANRKETIQRSATREQCVILRPKLRLNCASIYGGMRPGQSSKKLSRVAKDAGLHSIWSSRHSRVLLYYLDAYDTQVTQQGHCHINQNCDSFLYCLMKNTTKYDTNHAMQTMNTVILLSLLLSSEDGRAIYGSAIF